MEKRIEITTVIKIRVDEKHPEFNRFLNEYGNLNNMIKDAVKHNFSDIPIIENNIVQIIENSINKEVEIYG